MPHNSTVTAVQKTDAAQKTEAELRAEIQAAAKQFGEQIKERMQQRRGDADQAATTATPAVPAAPGHPQNIVIHPQGSGRGPVIVGETQVPWNPRETIPPEAVDMSIAFFFTVAVIVIGLPISRAFARRMDRKAAPSQVPREVSSQLEQLAQSVDAIALEVERISEGQRFTTRLLTEQRDATSHALPAGPDR